MVAIRVNKKMIDTNIYAYFSSSLREFFSRNVIAREGNEPFTSGSFSNGYSLNISLNRSGEKELKSTNISDIKIFTFNFPTSLLKGEGVIPVFRLKPRESSFAIFSFESLKEALKSSIYSLQHILETLRTYSLKLWKGFFKLWQLKHLFIDRNRLFVLPIDRDFLLKDKVIESPAYLKPFVTVSLCSLVYLSSIEVCLSHFCFFKNLSIARLISSATVKPVFLDNSLSFLICGLVK